MDVACTVKTMTYRVHTSALGLLELDGERIPVTIPANSYINAEQPPADGDKKQLVDVVWRGTALTMFACDLQSRTDVVTTAANGFENENAPKVLNV